MWEGGGGWGGREEGVNELYLDYNSLNDQSNYSSFILSVPGGREGWTDKLATELRKSYEETDEIYAYCSVRNGNPLPVSIESQSYKICDNPCLTLYFFFLS